MIVAGKLLFGTGWPKDWIELVVYVGAGVVCLAALGVAWSHVIPNYDAAAAYSNIIFLPVIFISGVFYDVNNAPQFLLHLAQVLPLVHIIDGLSGALVSGRSLSDNLSGLCVICIWTLVGLFFAVRGFSWESRRDSSARPRHALRREPLPPQRDRQRHRRGHQQRHELRQPAEPIMHNDDSPAASRARSPAPGTRRSSPG